MYVSFIVYQLSISMSILMALHRWHLRTRNVEASIYMYIVLDNAMTDILIQSWMTRWIRYRFWIMDEYLAVHGIDIFLSCRSGDLLDRTMTMTWSVTWWWRRRHSDWWYSISWSDIFCTPSFLHRHDRNQWQWPAISAGRRIWWVQWTGQRTLTVGQIFQAPACIGVLVFYSSLNRNQSDDSLDILLLPDREWWRDANERIQLWLVASLLDLILSTRSTGENGMAKIFEHEHHGWLCRFAGSGRLIWLVGWRRRRRPACYTGPYHRYRSFYLIGMPVGIFWFWILKRHLAWPWRTSSIWMPGLLWWSDPLYTFQSNCCITFLSSVDAAWRTWRTCIVMTRSTSQLIHWHCWWWSVLYRCILLSFYLLYILMLSFVHLLLSRWEASSIYLNQMAWRAWR